MNSKAAFHGEPKRIGPQGCLQSRWAAKPHTWRLHLSQPQRHISYLEVTVYDVTKKFAKRDIRKLVKSATVNELRACDVAKLPPAAYPKSSLRFSLLCDIEYDGDIVFEAWQRDVTEVR